VAVFVGSWISGFFIIATNAFMQHPVGYRFNGDKLQLGSLGDLLSNPWLAWQYLHNMSGAAISAAFLIAGMGAYFLLSGRNLSFGRQMLRIGVPAAAVLSLLQIFPTGDRQAKNVARYQQPTFAAMEGVFQSGRDQPLHLIGNPNTQRRRLESDIGFPGLLSFLTYERFTGYIRGLNDIPVRQWPDSVPLVYYAYHIMVGLGTILLLIAAVATLMLWRQRLFESRAALWALMLAVPFTYVANIAGWVTAETGRQPWIVWGLQRTLNGASASESVPSGAALFTLLGFVGLYLAAGLLYVLLILRIIGTGPGGEDAELPVPRETATEAA